MTSAEYCWEQQAAFHRILQAIHQEAREHRRSAIQLLSEQVMEYIRRNYKEPITNAILNKQFHFHPAYISRCMQKSMGCTPLHYLQRHRIDQARLLLANTNMSISDIAGEVGFDSNSYFTRCFQKMTDMSPRTYRNQFRV